jgi:hypothetical protein
MEATDPKVKPQDSAPTSSYFQYPSPRRKSWFPFDLETSEYDVLLLSTSLKLLLFPA